MNDPPRIGWLAEAIKLMYATAVQASSVQVKVSKELGQAFISHCGKKEVVDIPPPPRNHQLATLDDLKTAVNLWCNPSARGVLWVGLAKCVLVMDESKQRDKATLYTSLSQEWIDVQSIDDHPTFNTEELRVMCNDMAGTGLESLLSKLDSSPPMTDLPALIDITFPLILDSPLGTLRHRITHDIRIVEDGAKCSIVAKSGQMELVMANALGQLYTHLDTLLKDEQAAHKVVLIKGSPE